MENNSSNNRSNSCKKKINSHQKEQIQAKVQNKARLLSKILMWPIRNWLIKFINNAAMIKKVIILKQRK